MGFGVQAKLELVTDGKCCHSFTNYKHNVESQKVEILMRESDWQALPRHTVGTCVLVDQYPLSDPCVVKEVAAIKNRWRLMGKTEKTQTVFQGGSRVKVSSNCLCMYMLLHMYCLNMPNSLENISLTENICRLAMQRREMITTVCSWMSKTRHQRCY